MIAILNQDQINKIDKNQQFAIRSLRYAYGPNITLTTIIECEKFNPIVAICENESSTFCFLTIKGMRSPRFLARGNNYNECLLLIRTKLILEELENNITSAKHEQSL